MSAITPLAPGASRLATASTRLVHVVEAALAILQDPGPEPESALAQAIDILEAALRHAKDAL
jgi:hypothetical protein